MLGERFGLSAQEMNHALKRLGLLDGSPGDYSVTEQGAPYALERDYHQGNGGYACYNAYWTTRSWDESILDQLDLSNEFLAETKREVAERRRLMRQQAAAWAQETQPAQHTNQAQTNGGYKAQLLDMAIGYLPEIASWLMAAGRKRIPALLARIGK